MNLYLAVAGGSGKIAYATTSTQQIQPFVDNLGYEVFTIPGVIQGVSTDYSLEEENGYGFYHEN